MAFDKSSTKIKNKDVSEWYLTTLKEAEIFEYGPVRGTMILRPYGYAIWEKTQGILDVMFKKGGVQNAYFPLFIPYSLLEKEKNHIEGFSPETAVVTHAGGEKLEEPIVVRPTSETIIYDAMSKWIQSYRDLPLLLNQWCNVVRWEKRTMPFMRTSEFLWQEGHTAHETYEEAEEMAMRALSWYKELYEDYFGIAVFAGQKSESEKFAGAKKTFTLELIMPDGKALQGATSHVFDNHFSAAYGVEFLDKNNNKKAPYTTSWGFSTRSLAGLFMVHGDDAGLVLPPRIAPVRVVIMPIYGKSKKEADIHKAAHTLGQILEKKDINFTIDINTDKALPTRRAHWEKKGVPLRIEIGEKELEENTLTLVRRDTLEKRIATQGNVLNAIEEIEEQIQTALYNATRLTQQDGVVEVETYDEFKKAIEQKKRFVRAYFVQDPKIEAKIKEETKATTRVLTFEAQQNEEWGYCMYTGKKTRDKWLFAQSY